MKTYLTDMLFWIAIIQWVFAAPIGAVIGTALSELVPRIFPVPIQMILESIVLAVVVCAAFALPLFLTGNIPIPCCERNASYRFGTVVGIGLLVIGRYLYGKLKVSDCE